MFTSGCWGFSFLFLSERWKWWNWGGFQGSRSGKLGSQYTAVTIPIDDPR